MYPASLSSAAARAGPASSRSCAATTTLSRGAERGDEAGGGRDVVGGLGAPSEECGCGAERRRIGPLPTMTSFGTGQKIVVMRSSLIDVSRGVSGSNSSVLVDVAVVEVGDEADRSPVEQPAPEIWRKIVFADGDDASGTAAVSPATSASTSLMVTSTRRLPTGTSTRAPERSEPIRPPPGVIATASERSRSGKSSSRRSTPRRLSSPHAGMP